VLKRIIMAIRGFFMQTRLTPIEEQLAELSSVEHMEAVKQTAFRELQKPGSFSGHAPDGNEAEIHAECVRIDIELSNRYSKDVSELVNDVRILEAHVKDDVDHALVSLSIAAVQSEISAIAGQSKPTHTSLAERLRTVQHDLKIFQGANSLTGPADSPASVTAAFIYLAIFAVLEAFANMLFLRTGSSVPVASLIAISAAFMNVGVSAFLGTVYRFKNHVISTERRKGAWALLGALLFILLLNTGVAIARLVIAQDFSPKSINSVFVVESTILYLVGILFGLIAFRKGYTLDDRYPGYGKIYSNWLNAQHEYDDAEESFRKSCDAIVSRAERNLAMQHEELDSYAKRIEKTHDDLRSKVSAWRHYRSSLTQTYQGLISAYRGIAKAFLANSNRSVPEYFSVPVELPDNALIRDANDEIQRIDSESGIRNERKRVNQQKIIDKRSELLNWRATKYPSLIKALWG